MRVVMAPPFGGMLGNVGNYSGRSIFHCETHYSSSRREEKGGEGRRREEKGGRVVRFAGYIDVGLSSYHESTFASMTTPTGDEIEVPDGAMSIEDGIIMSQHVA